jgi:hypothetical protein
LLDDEDLCRHPYDPAQTRTVTAPGGMRRHRLVVGLCFVAAALIMLVCVAAVAGMTQSKTQPVCTHGASSIGPVTLVDGKVVGGSTVPHTEACLH